ncbi:Pex12 amino terminal region-domain-containing protein [Microdochium trichocladiopsis]|uniref:Peroxisome assembly protein 12 n=1 Tax=Microdochium trichocladiopsis TaxID=1682393 RepID=A0A9P8YBG4_9PEZI|nr:Pex12 amino terminal region-domain-containing protein [Microdochium trichocladiopsis]KAH7035423.1 Pex12 amino terminal region-domain-containing protein [Microdochium trichocladiopsis]
MEFMAALRGSFDDQKPSLFELLSEQQLSSLLPPTLRYLLTVATQRYPRYLLRPLNSFDELYALLMVLVERHYLLTRGGSFTEHFYGLKREKALEAEVPRAAASSPAVVRDTLKLTTGDVWKNLAVMVGIPYLKRKLDDTYEVEAPRALLGSSYTRMPANPSVKQRILHYYKWFVRNVYPSVHAAYYFAIIAFNLAYLFDGSKYHNPFLWLIGTRVRRMNGADYHAIEQLTKPTAAALAGAGRPAPGGFFNPRTLGPRLLGSLSVLLPTSIFALKFLEWWYASDFAKQLSRKAAETLELPPPIISGLGLLSPPPASQSTSSSKHPASTNTRNNTDSEEPATQQPQPHPLAENAPIATPSLLPILTVPAPEDSEVCPICEDDMTTPTACQTGVVYCYTCIHRWVEGAHPKQEAFMAGGSISEPESGGGGAGAAGGSGSREGKWESGKGRCAVTGRRLLGGTEGLRRIMFGSWLS